MRPLIILLILFLSSVASGCRTTMKTVKESSDVANVEAETSNESATNEEILSILTQRADVDLSGIVIEYYAPDPITPDARASPKTVTIERASAKSRTEASEHKESSTAENAALIFSSHQQRAESIDDKIEAQTSSPYPMLIVIALSGALIFFRLRR